ncbi:MAG: biotin/lipoyl-binding protein [Thermoflexaceae bacterium]|nr:biotin/lipoyl-binding protein [Thermoflexaceae bacterium]
MAEKYLIRDEDGETVVEIERRENSVLARRQGSEAWREVQLERIGDSDLYVLMVDSRPVELYLERRRGGAVVTIGRHIFDYDVAPWRPVSKAVSLATPAANAVRRITAPMTGAIVETRCHPGDAVEQGQVLLVIESMKMNNELRAPGPGIVEAVPVSPGQRVKAGDLLVSLRGRDNPS